MAFVVCLAVAAVAEASPASAHSVAGVSGTNFKTRLKSVTPPVDGLFMSVIEVGSRLELVNKSGKEIVVLGYQDEPYLRIGPDGVFENTRSPATYLNADRKATLPVPANADPDAPAEWRKVSAENVVRWHDHRAHWMGDRDPPPVRRNPGREHVVFPEWKVELRVDGQPVMASGDMRWIPPPSAAPWLVLAVVLLIGCLLAARSTSWAPLLLVALSVLLVVDVVHEFGIGWANAGSVSVKVGRVVLGSFFAVVAWVVAVIGMRQLAKRVPDGVLLAAFAGLVVALFGGLGDLPSLFNSQVPFAWSPALARFSVAVSLGLGFGLVGAAVVAGSRHKLFAAEPEPDPDADPA